MDDGEEDSIMREIDLHVAIQPLAGTAQQLVKREPSSSDIQGCDQACGPSVMRESSTNDADEDANISGTTMIADDPRVHDVLSRSSSSDSLLLYFQAPEGPKSGWEMHGRVNKRVRTREPSVEL